MANKTYEIVVSIIVNGLTLALTRPLLENIKDYTVIVEASFPEDAEKKAMDNIAADKSKFNANQDRIRIAEIRAIDGSPLVYKDDKDDYRRLSRALRPYHMWPYLERCKEFARDYCVYNGLSVEEAAKFIAADPDVSSSPAREIRGDKFTAVQEILAEVKRQNEIRYERAHQPKAETEKSAPAENKDPLYPEAGAERYHRMDPEVAKELAKQGRPEQVIQIDDFERQDFYDFSSHKEENEMMYNKICHLLEDNLAEVERRGQNVIITGDTGHMAILISGTMVDFARTLYVRCEEIFNKEHTADIRKGLEELFGNNKAKQKTTSEAASESVENNLTDDEESLVSEGTSATVGITFDVELSDGRLVKVARRTSIKQDEKDVNFLYGYVYRNGEYVGYWQWNRKHYSLPIYKPQQAMKKTSLGERNSRRLCTAIKNAVCGK